MFENLLVSLNRKNGLSVGAGLLVSEFGRRAFFYFFELPVKIGQIAKANFQADLGNAGIFLLQ